MDLSTITVADFKSLFVRDFPYLPADQDAASCNVDDYVLDSDITRAMLEAKFNFNQALFGSDEKIKLCYLYLSAHYMVKDLKAAKQGIYAAASFPVESRKVGNVSESYGIPKKYLENPLLIFYTDTYYGLKYLSYALPKLVGNVAGIQGVTHA